jgi:hypothetical protein
MARGITISEFERRQLKVIRDELDAEFTARKAPLVSPTTTSPTGLSSTQRT